MSYKQALSIVPFYAIHPEYMPFIGEKYDDYKILIVGESHYIGQSPETQKFTIDYFEKHWWDGSCSELDAAYAGWYNTVQVVKKYLAGIRRRGHSIFTNCIKSFSNVVLGQPVNHISTEESQKFQCLAFINFFQMPSLFEGMKFWDSLTKNNSKEKASLVWNKTVLNSSAVLDCVIDIIKPKLVIFVSKSAYHAYKNSNAKHKDDNNVKGVCHPGCGYWNKPRKSDGLSGKDDFENCLKQYIGCCDSLSTIPINDSWKYLRVQKAGTTFDFNFRENLYYDNIDRGFRAHNYLGLYKEKSVRAIGHICARILAVETENGMNYESEMGEITEERKQRILYAIKDAERYGYDLHHNKHRYFFVEKFFECDFRKISKRAPMGSRIFNLTEVLKTDELPDTEEIAKRLTQITWE